MLAVKAAYEKSNKPLGDIVFMALSGHVCGLKLPNEYPEWSEKKWGDLSLPLKPEHFEIKVLRPDIVKRISDALKKNHFEGIIVGTDSDVEGNGIYALLEEALHLEKYKALRFFETGLTDAEIMKSFGKLTDFHTHKRDVGMTEAFRIRSHFDWLIGMNLTIAYTVKANMLLRIGRVKAPTLKLVYDNCREIDCFVKRMSYLPVIQTENPQIVASLVDEKGSGLSFPDREKAALVLQDSGEYAEIIQKEKKIKKTPAPQLYNLTDIQVEAGQRYGYSPSEVSDITQKLYEQYKVLSYPRTEGRYLSTEKSMEFPMLLKAAQTLPGLYPVTITKEDFSRVRSDKRFVNNEEVEKTSHDALIPTGKIPDWGKMNEKEKIILSMIYRRFVSMFLPALKEEKTKYVLNANGNLYMAKGSKVSEPGFSVIYERQVKEYVLPDIPQNKKISIDRKGIKEIESKPPKRFSEALLVSAMENIQRYMQKGELKDIMKKAKGIGKPSSRAAIIKDLIDTGYMEKKKNGLYITEKGKKYIEVLDGHSILNPELTASWELHMQNIREGNESYNNVHSMILEYVNESLKELEHKDFSSIRQKNNNNFIEGLNCPLCGKPMRQLQFGYVCSGYPDCRFSVPHIVCSKKLTDNQMKNLIQKGKTSVLKGFVSKKGTKFDAALSLENGQVKFVFPER